MVSFLRSVVLGAVFVRCGWLLIGIMRVGSVHRAARIRKWGVIEVLTLAELPLFFALAYYLYARPVGEPVSGLLVLLPALVGALLALAGVAVSIWAIRTTVRMGVILDAGHFIKHEHPLITTGAYGFVRNPMYLGVILIWLGAGIAYRELEVLLLAVFYVAPAYVLYGRSEDKMLLLEFGAEYARYRERVGAFLPRWSRSP